MSYLQELVLKLIDNSLRDIIENFVPPHNMPNWKIQLIKDPALLDKNTSHYIAIPEDNSYCYLLKSKRPKRPPIFIVLIFSINPYC